MPVDFSNPLYWFMMAGGIIVMLFAVIILWKIATDKIDLKNVLCDGNDGKASLSRLQFLIFTFVVGLSYFILVLRASSGTAPDEFTLPEISNGVLGLMGISGGSYVLSKGISKTAETATAKADADTAKADAETAKADAPVG